MVTGPLNKFDPNTFYWPSLAVGNVLFTLFTLLIQCVVSWFMLHSFISAAEILLPFLKDF